MTAPKIQNLEICNHGIIKKCCAACHEAEKALGAAAASWKLTWFVTGWINGHSEEHECLDDALEQLEELSDDPTLQITLTREGQLPPNDQAQRPLADSDAGRKGNDGTT